MSWEDLWPLLLDGTLDTLYMVGLAALFTVLIGLPTGVLLFISRANGLAPMPKLNALLGAVINIGRSLPFIVLLIALIPFTRLIVGTTLTIVMLIGFSSMAGVIGGGGLGDLAIRYGYQRFNNEVMFGTVLILVAMVQGVQMAGDRLVRRLAHRR
ncbi:TPA: metal ABC transporter permease [Klebsiella pneumoniae]|uniref:metal ABC transporter permease n=1 Tax=Klebsiella pneumoniae TaxID=573 RepID=UPI002850C67E|nr:metal ABC transporter permease [Klebsiella pneumoniae]MDR4685016.1 metal ABC transporter permease [Klebsiella pneumoniae]